MISFLSVLTSIKDYVEITHKLLEADPNLFQIKSYDEITALLTYFILSLKEFLFQFLTLNWIKDFWSLPVIVPDIASAMISEISILDGSFHNVFSFLETPLEYGKQNFVFYGFEKFFIGLINSLFLILPTSASHIITLRRFVMQGVEIGYLAGLGTLAGNMVWLFSIIFGLRFFVIPWLSFDIFRYIFGFVLLVKYLWDSTKEKRMVLEDVNKSKIFLLNFLLALTEQTCIYPFLSNISIGSEVSLLETFPSESFQQFIFIHGAYLFGIFVGSYSLLLLSSWFWEYPAFTIYLWIQTKSNYRFTTKFYYKLLNNIFSYLTMLAAISSIPYYGLDYSITKQLGFVPQDRLLTQKPSLENRSEYERLLTETSFLDLQPTNINLRVRDGQRPRRERWKQNFIKYEAVDVSLYDQGVYDFLTIEDLNYGFDRFWFKRKMRSHTTHFRFFPGTWMLTLKKQLLGPGQEARRNDFFTLLFEQYYHPNFHKMNRSATSSLSERSKLWTKPIINGSIATKLLPEKKVGYVLQAKTRAEFSALRKFVRKFNTRIKTSEINLISRGAVPGSSHFLTTPAFRDGEGSRDKKFTKKIYSKRWKNLYANIWRSSNKKTNQSYIKNPFRSLSKNVFLQSTKIQKKLNLLFKKEKQYNNLQKFYNFETSSSNKNLIEKTLISENFKRTLTREKLSKKDRQILRFRTQLFLTNVTPVPNSDSKKDSLKLFQNKNSINFKVGSLLHPLKFYVQKEESFRRKLKFYGSAIFRKLSIGNNAPYFRTIMKRGFYYYKKTLRWKRTENVAALRRGLRKTYRTPRKLVKNKQLKTGLSIQDGKSENESTSELRMLGNMLPFGEEVYPFARSSGTPQKESQSPIIKPNHFYSNVGKRTSRYRFQIYKDVLQHWYYTPFNRLLLRFDIDAFINRQPKNHFLTNKEEQLLHLRRVLLGEHYDTLRWYTFMEHYRSMKTRIGSTKSFASRPYNQQFQGTFKKIRHLFAITPSQTNSRFLLTLAQNDSLNIESNSTKLLSQSINFKDSQQQVKIQKETPSLLKFDQPLYNEYPNSSKTLTKQSGSILEKSFFHEELLLPLKTSNKVANPIEFIPKESGSRDLKGTGRNADALRIESELEKTNASNIVAKFSNETASDDLINKSTKLVGLFLLKAEPARKESIKNFIKEEKYPELLKFLYLGQKSQGNQPILSQKQAYSNVFSLFNWDTSIENRKTMDKIDKPTKSIIQEELWVNFLKESKKRLNNRKFMKKYINYRVTKREKRISQKLKMMKKRLQKLKTWLIPSLLFDYLLQNTKETLISTSGLEKSFKKGVLILKTKQELATSFLISKANTTIQSLQNLEQIEFFKTKLKIQLSLQTLKKVLETKSCALCISPSKLENRPLQSIFQKGKELRNMNNLVVKSQKRLKIIIKDFLTKTKPLYFFLKERPQRAKHYFWKKRQKVKAKAKKQRKKILEKSIPDQKRFSNYYFSYANQLNRNKNVYYDKWVLQEFPSSYFSKQKLKEQSYKQALGSALTEEGYQKIIPRFKQSDSTNIFKKFINKKLFNKKFVFREYKKKRKKSKRSEYYPRYFYDYSYSKLRKIKWISKQSFKEKARMMSKNKKLRILKNGGLFYTLISKISSSSSDRNNETSKFLANSSNFDLTWLKVDITKKHQPRKKKRKKRKFSIKKKYQKLINQRSKFNKRTIYRKGKLKKLAKQLKHIKSNIQLQLWWWQTYLPKFELDFLTRTKIESSNEVAKLQEVNKIISNAYNIKSSNEVTLGNFDFKPLTILLNKDTNQIISNADNIISKADDTNSDQLNQKEKNSINTEKKEISQKVLEKTKNQKEKESQNLIQSVYNNILVNSEFHSENPFLYPETSNTNSLPFYAGWDESSRKLIITNRILSRRDAGFNFQNLNQFNNLQSLSKIYKENELNFSMSPIFGLNEVSFLYWENEMPFTIYNIEQYNTNVISFYAPLGWRRFEFRHSILKAWLDFIKINQKSIEKSQKLNLNLKKDSLKINSAKTLDSFISFADTNNLFLNRKDQIQLKDSSNIIQKIQFKQKRISQKFRNRRIRTRYKRVKLGSSTFVFKPQGPLLTDILPSHYLSVFNSQYRLPRHRYLKYKLIKNSISEADKPLISTTEYNNFIKASNDVTISFADKKTSFTLRKRSKPKRKFHRKRLIKPNGLIFPRRRKFIINEADAPTELKNYESKLGRWRPSIESEFNLNQLKTRVKTDTIRRRKLRRKMFKQVYKPIQRFQPRFGGYTWPGDYPRLAWTDMPKLEIKKLENFETIQRKKLNKEKRRLGMVGDLPHKYLLKKHNLLVLKKKLEKAQRSNKITQRAREFKKEFVQNIPKN